MLLRLAAIEGAGRADLVDCALRRIWAGTERLPMMHRDGWRGPRNAAGGQPFAWFVFEPGARQGPIEMSRITWRGAPAALKARKAYGGEGEDSEEP